MMLALAGRKFRRAIFLAPFPGGVFPFSPWGGELNA